MLNEYARYKEYQENIDRKSLYQKHVQKLAELSKTCHDQSETIKQKNSKISQLEEIIVKKENELQNLLKQIADYDITKEQEIQEVDNRYKQQILDFIERIDYLNKENRKIPLLEKQCKDLADKMQEDKIKYLSALDKSEDRYKLLTNKLTEKDREIWNLKEKIKELEFQIKLMQEQNQVAVLEKCNEYERKLSKLEIDQHAINLQFNKQEKQLISEITQLKEQQGDLRKQILEAEQKAQVREQNLSNVIQSQTEQYQQYKMEAVNQLADILSKNENLESVVEEKRQIIETKTKELQQKTTKITELQKKIESLISSKEKMKEDHEKEMNKIFKTKQDETTSLTFKIKELKLYYEVEIENLKKECDDRVKEHSSNATDAKRQYIAMKNNFNQDIEGKENEIEFLKNKIYEEKQKMKEQQENSYKEMIKDMQKRITFLQNELDEQKIEIENNICEDLAVYNRQSKYWKKSRDIRDEKYSYKSINSEESSKREITPLKKRQTISSKPNQNQHLTHQDILRIKFQVVAKCAVAFEEQQQKIDKFRSQIDNLSKKANNLLKHQYMSGGANRGGVVSQFNNDDQNGSQFHEFQRQNALMIDNDLSNDKDFYLDENDLKDLELAKQVKELREQLYQQKLKNQEIQNQFIQREYELNESHKLEKKNLQKQFDSVNQVKIQQVFEKDILLEKQITKIADLERLLEDSTVLIKSQTEFTEKMRKQFEELDQRNKDIVKQIQDEKEELLSMWDNRESLSKDLREIERLNLLVSKLNNEIKQLKQSMHNLNNMKSGNAQQGLVFESQLRTSYDFPLTQKQIPTEIGSNNSLNQNNQINFNKSDFLPLESKNNELQKLNLNKSINIPQKEFKRDVSRPRTKTSFKMEKDALDSSTINSNKNQ